MVLWYENCTTQRGTSVRMWLKIPETGSNGQKGRYTGSLSRSELHRTEIHVKLTDSGTISDSERGRQTPIQAKAEHWTRANALGYPSRDVFPTNKSTTAKFKKRRRSRSMRRRIAAETAGPQAEEPALVQHEAAILSSRIQRSRSHPGCQSEV